MTNFSINPNFQMGNFDNSINEFNKVFNNSIKDANKAFSEIEQGDFQKILNSISPQKPMEAGVAYNVGMDSISAQKIDNLSPVAQMASDIGQGLKNSIENLNSVQKDSERKTEFFAAGGDISIHDVMISAQKSSLAMQMAIQLRNQIVNAYNELKNISV
ncbi:MAG: flagellar hook-basal body complex protein FliE [Candidatus Gastranaerophilales bacterium]|nr:flagellar hook-basal body complex protein FliE [Candidatus Gastranaerophilales bacterium]